MFVELRTSLLEIVCSNLLGYKMVLSKCSALKAKQIRRMKREAAVTRAKFLGKVHGREDIETGW